MKFFKILLLLFFLLIYLYTLNANNESDNKDYLARVRVINEQIEKRLTQPVKQLDIDLIMEGNNFYGTMPAQVRWDGDGSRLWFLWKQWNEEVPGTYEYILKSGRLRRLSKEEAEQIPSSTAIWDKAHKKAMWTVRDTVWLFDGIKKKSVPLISGIGNTPPEPDYSLIGDASMIFYSKIAPVKYVGTGAVEPITFSSDGTKAILYYHNNLYAVTLEGGIKNGIITKLTDIREGNPPKQEPPTASQKYIKSEQAKLFDVLQRRLKRKNREKARIEKNKIKPFYLKGWNIFVMIPSNDLSFCTVFLSRQSPNARVEKIPDFITASGYTENIPTYIKAGDELAEFKVGIIELASGHVGWVDFNQPERSILPYYFHWHPDNDRGLITFIAGDNKDSWLGVLEPEFQKEKDTCKIPVRILVNEHDDAWVNPLAMDHFGWLPRGDSAWFISERDGWMNLYRVPTKGGDIKPLFKGNFLVLRPQLVNDPSAPDGKSLLFYATVNNPFEMQTYLLPLPKGNVRQLSTGLGRAEGILSPPGTHLAVTTSKSNQPWELFVKEVDKPGMGTRITRSSSPAFNSYPWKEPEIIHFKARDNTPVPARLYLPAALHPKKPAVIFAHGGGWIHNVHNWWASYAHEYCFHHLLMEQGYIVLDIDFRGSAGYGRDWRTAVYRDQLAGKVSDVVDGSKYLTEKYGIEPERIGIYGGSGGGVITLMALFTAPKSFGAGAALRSLPDIAHYAPGLSLKVLNSPQEDPDAYYRSSPIYYADGLEDPLLICHGTSDINTHFQGVVRLIQRLIELRKTNWELAVYPMESHSFVEPSSWADEYRRIFELFEENLKK